MIEETTQSCHTLCFLIPCSILNIFDDLICCQTVFGFLCPIFLNDSKVRESICSDGIDCLCHTIDYIHLSLGNGLAVCIARLLANLDHWGYVIHVLYILTLTLP